MGTIITTRGQMRKGGSEKVHTFQGIRPGDRDPESISGSVFTPDLMWLTASRVLRNTIVT